MFKIFSEALASGDIGTAVSSTVGQIITWSIAILLLVILLLISMKGKEKKTPKQLTYSAIAIALATGLSYISIIKLPQGGSVTLCSMLMIVLIGYWFGAAQGVIAGVVYGLIQLALGGYVMHPVQLLLDYPIAFGVLGLAGVFSKSENGLMKGYLLGTFLRFIIHVISGIVFFAEYAPEGFTPFAYSIGYNITYIGVEVFITVILMVIPSFSKAMRDVKKNALT